MTSADRVSQVLGWSYFACWSLSFYPQVVLNFRTKKTEGLSVDFSWLNCLGFACYAVFNCMMFWNARVKLDSETRHGEGLVQLNDVFFSLHALLLTGLTLGQVYWYAMRNATKPALVHPAVKLFFLVTVCGLALSLRITAERDVHWDPNESFWEHNLWTWLGWCLLLSMVKLSVTLFKYFPQAYLNCTRRSTLGWSIGNVLLDFAGGVLSLAQLCVDSKYQLGSLSHVLDNPVKLFLACFSIGFDLVFIAQHYVLFPERGDAPLPNNANEWEALVETEDELGAQLENEAVLNRAAIPPGRRRAPTANAPRRPE